MLSKPTTARAPTFRSLLTKFFSTLTIHLPPPPPASPQLNLLKSWTVALSSSPFRPFRHTATVVALSILTGLCDVSKNVWNEHLVAVRQRDAEQKKTTGRNNSKLNGLNQRCQELDERRQGLDEEMKDLFDR